MASTNLEVDNGIVGVNVEEANTIVDDIRSTTTNPSMDFTGISILRHLEKEEDAEDSSNAVSADSEEENTVDKGTKIATSNIVVDKIGGPTYSSDFIGISIFRQLEKEKDTKDSSNTGGAASEEENITVDEETKITTSDGVVDKIGNTATSNNLTGISLLRQLEKEEDAMDNSRAISVDLEEDVAADEETKITTSDIVVDKIDNTATSNNLTRESLLCQLKKEEDAEDNARAVDIDLENIAVDEEVKINTSSITKDAKDVSRNATSVDLKEGSTTVEEETKITPSKIKDAKNSPIGVDIEEESTTVDEETKIITSNASSGILGWGQLQVDEKYSENCSLAEDRDDVTQRPLSPTVVIQKLVGGMSKDTPITNGQNKRRPLSTSLMIDYLLKKCTKNIEPADANPNKAQITNAESTIVKKIANNDLSTAKNNSISNAFFSKSILQHYMKPKLSTIEKLAAPIKVPKLTNRGKDHKVSNNFLDDIEDTNSDIGTQSIGDETQSIGDETQSIGDGTQTCNNDSVYNLTPLLQLEKRFIKLVKRKKWSAVEEFLNLNDYDRQAIASSKPLFCGNDYPLHLICDYNARIRERMRIIKELEKEKKKDEDKKKAKYDRIRRRRHGENVDTVYDSDEWTSSDDESDLSDDSGLSKKNQITKGGSVKKIEEMLPPTSLILALLKTYPQAAKCKGWNARLPLHHVVRHNYPLDVIKAMILVHPEALDIKDNTNQTPRDIINLRLDCTSSKWDSEICTNPSKTNSIEEGVEVSLYGYGTAVEINHVKKKGRMYNPGLNVVEVSLSTKNGVTGAEVDSHTIEMYTKQTFLDCPVSCWTEHSGNIKCQNKVDNKISDIEGEVEILQDTLVDISEECAYIDETMDDLTKRVEDYLVSSMEAVQLYERCEILEMTLGPEFEKLNAYLEVAESWDTDTYHQTEEHTKYIRAFNEDIDIVYNKMNSDMAAIKEEMKSLKLI